MIAQVNSPARLARPVLFMLAAGVFFALALARPAGAEMKIDAAYPGGNVVVDKVERNIVYVRPDLRDIKKGQWWFYWNFRVTGAAGKKLSFRFTAQNPIGARGPALTRDGGASWSWMGAAAVRALDTKPPAWEFDYDFPTDNEVRFAFCIPYLQADLQKFLARHNGNAALEIGELCQTRKGRPVECLRLGKLQGEPKCRVLLTARHHACESMADYVMEGFMDAVLEDSAQGRAWRDQAEIMAVPFMDKDGVEDGDQGKNRNPHDHNRDYGEGSLYPEVRALKARVPEWSGGKLAVALDLHCPHIRGTNNEHIYFVGSRDPEIWKEATRMGGILEKTRTGPLPYAVAGNVPYGTSWNTSANTTDGMSCGQWASGLKGIRVASSIEHPYANVKGVEMTADAARAFGRDLARAVAQYLEIR